MAWSATPNTPPSWKTSPKPFTTDTGILSLSVEDEGKNSFREVTVGDLIMTRHPGSGDEKLFVPGGFLLGRRSPAHFLPEAFSSRVLSRSHAQLLLDKGGRIYVVDLGSMHGTSIMSRNGRTIQLQRGIPKQLLDGDVLTLGKTVGAKMGRDRKNHHPLLLQVGVRFKTAQIERQTALQYDIANKNDVSQVGRALGLNSVVEIPPRRLTHGYGLDESALYESETDEVLPHGGNSVSLIEVEDDSDDSDDVLVVEPSPKDISPHTSLLEDSDEASPPGAFIVQASVSATSSVTNAGAALNAFQFIGIATNPPSPEDVPAATMTTTSADANDTEIAPCVQSSFPDEDDGMGIQDDDATDELAPEGDNEVSVGDQTEENHDLELDATQPDHHSDVVFPDERDLNSLDPEDDMHWDDDRNDLALPLGHDDGMFPVNDEHPDYSDDGEVAYDSQDENDTNSQDEDGVCDSYDEYESGSAGYSSSVREYDSADEDQAEEREDEGIDDDEVDDEEVDDNEDEGESDNDSDHESSKAFVEATPDELEWRSENIFSFSNPSPATQPKAIPSSLIEVRAVQETQSSYAFNDSPITDKANEESHPPLRAIPSKPTNSIFSAGPPSPPDSNGKSSQAGNSPAHNSIDLVPHRHLMGHCDAELSMRATKRKYDEIAEEPEPKINGTFPAPPAWATLHSSAPPTAVTPALSTEANAPIALRPSKLRRCVKHAGMAVAYMAVGSVLTIAGLCQMAD